VQVPTAPEDIAEMNWFVQVDVVMFMSALTTDAHEGFPAPLPCATVVVVPWLANCAPARTRDAQVNDHAVD
jgi:hypothetical protein